MSTVIPPEAPGADGPPPGEPLFPTLRIEDELKESYLNYAMSVIVSRALPDVRDGLKPSQRRILTAMHDMNLSPGGSTTKCASVVGRTMERYHPHGDNSIYPTLARMGQWWNMRHLLVTPQGNFGSIHGLPPAAMRYTECKLSPVAAEMLEDIAKDTVDFQANYDGKFQEPIVLPSKFPNLVVNGSGGIAVGMATSIPPHNLGEVCDALVALIDDPEITLDGLLAHLPGPDFPTGSTICGQLGIREAYMTGRGRITLRAKYVFETTREGREQIVFTEIPYQLTKETLLKKLADLVNGDRLSGVADVVDESDRKQPVRIVVKVKKGEVIDVVLNQIFHLSPLQDTFGVNMLALVDGRPVTLPLKRMLQHFIDHRINVIRRRCQYELRQAKARAHILEGLLIALEHIDLVIKIIRGSANPPEAKARLIGMEVSVDLLRRALDDPEAQPVHGLTPNQADAILAMRLQQLTNLEADKIVQEYKQLRERIGELERILADERLILDLIRADLRELKHKYADARRSIISGEEIGNYDKEALIQEAYMVVTITKDGYIKRLAPSTYRAQGRGGRGVSATGKRENDALAHMFVALTHDYILFFTDRGKVYWLKVYDIPEAGRTAAGRAVVNLLDLKKADETFATDERITGLIPVRYFNEDEALLMVTRRGTVKKTKLSAFKRPLRGGIIALGLDQGDELISVERVREGDDVVLSASSGMAIRFAESGVRAMGRTAHGVRGINLAEGDRIVGMVKTEGVGDPAQLLTICANGYGKRTALTDYRTQARGGKGLIDIKTSERNGPVVAVAKVNDDDEVMLTTARGMAIRTAVAGISVIGRNTNGVRVMNLNEDDQVVSVAKLPPEELSDDGEVPDVPDAPVEELPEPELDAVPEPADLSDQADEPVEPSVPDND